MNPIEITIRKAIARSQSGELREAVRIMMPLLKDYPADPEIQSSMGLVLLYGLDPDQALIYFQRARDAQPENPKHRLNIALALSSQRKFGEALVILEEVLRHHPDSADAMQLRGSALESLGRYQEAFDQADRLIKLDPEREAAWITRMVSAAILQPEKAFAAYQEAADARPDSIEIARMTAMESNYEPDLSDDEVLAFHRRFGELIEAANPPRYKWDSVSSEPKRIGIVSSDFRDHVVANFAIPLIKALQLAGYQVKCYAIQGQPDELTKKIAKLTSLTMMLTAPTPVVAERIHRDRIDVLIDLNGLTAHHRLDLFAMQPAPIQMTMIGYPNTTGMSRLQYRVGDWITDPSEQDGQLTERVLRMEPPFLCFEPTNDYPAPIEKERGFVFGSYNNPRKITPEVLSVWCSLLEQCPEALIIFKSGSYDQGGYREWVTAPFAAQGLSGRIQVIGRTPSFAEHLASYNEIDVLLDTWPYGGTTTTYESLMMGVPFVTMEGNSHRSRVGSSIAQSLGFPEWVGRNPEEYVSAVIRLAESRPEKSVIKTALHDSKLMDIQNYSERVRSFIEAAWATPH